MKTSCSLLRSGESRRQYFFIGLFFFSLFLSGKIFGQQLSSDINSNPSSGVTANVNFSVDPFTPYFIENKGQFDQYDVNNSKRNFKSPSYGSQMGNAILLFNGSSVQFVESIIKNEENEKKEKEKDLSEERVIETWRQTLNFVNANPNATFEVEQSQQQYFTYPDPNIENGTITANGWGKLICKNIYPGIDVEFSYKKEGGIKYSFIVHPGADASLIKMEWSGVDNIVVDENGNLQMKSENGMLTDKAPASFYLNEESAAVSSGFIVKGKTVSFSLGNYDHAKTLVIDPWVLSPALLGNNRAYDIQHDPSGNIYVYGGSNPYQLKKFTSAGAPIWSYNTSATGYYGDFVIDGTGNAYCVYGPWGDRTIKLTPAGVLVWNVFQNGSREIYRVYPNPVNVGQLTIMGMGMPAGPLRPMVLNINMASGAYTGPFLHPSCNGETRGMAVDVNGDAYGLVWSTGSPNAANNIIWKVNSANATVLSVPSGYLLGESDPSNTDSWFSGFNGMTVGCYLYSYDGQTVKKWNKTTLALMATATIPGGVHYVTSGLCTDVCGNVYVGGPNSILEFDGNLTLLTTVPTTGQVYDVNIGNVPGEILACGNGFFGSYSFPVCTSSTISMTSTPATCSACNGTATITMNPAGSYTYSWSPSGGNNATATGLCPGTYTVTAVSGCYTYTASIVIPTSGGGLTMNTTQTNATCSSLCNGSATSTVTNGTGPYTFTWSPTATNSTSTNVNTGSNLCAGTYTIDVVDASGCTASNTITITQPPLLTTTTSQIDPLCHGGTGTGSVAATGGSGPFTFAWTPSGGSGSTSTPVVAGNYTCTVTESNGCTTILPFTIVEPAVLASTMSTTPANCGSSNGTATVNPSGGTGPYTFVWSPSGGVNATATGLLAGTYTCNITDVNGCTAVDSVTVVNVGSPVATITSHTDVLCFGGNNGDAIVTVVGGTTPYVYAWSPIGGAGNVGTGLTAQAYTVTVTDANGCITTDTITITEPPLLTASVTSSPVLCNGGNTGSATVTVTGGVTAYVYAWSPSGGAGSTAPNLTMGSYTCTVTDANGCTTTASTTVTEPAALTTTSSQIDELCNGGNNASATVTPAGGTTPYLYAWSPSGGSNATASTLLAGTYTVTITDANSCVITQSFTITEPNAIVVTLTEIDAHCNQSDGSASSTTVGGTGAYIYNWMPGNVATQNLTNVPSGNYTLTVTDANNCTGTASITINNLSGVTASVASSTNIACFGQATGSISITQTGGTGPYTYAWLPNITVNNSISNIPAGTYQVTVTDVNGCSSVVSVTLTQPPLLTIAATSTPTAVCNGSPVTINSTPAGGTPVLNVLWTPGNLSGNSQILVPTATTTYTATVTDANGCTATATTNVVVNPVPVAALVGDLLSGCAPVCVNFTDGSTVTSPGVINSWSWNFGDSSPLSTAQNPTHCYNTAGVYTVILNIVTADGCTSTITMPNYINVFVNPIAAFGASPQPATMMDPLITFTDSSINASSWLWSFGDILNSSSTLQNPTFSYSDPTCYQVVLTVSTINGCTDTAAKEVCIGPEVTIFVPNAFTPNADGNNDAFQPVGVGIDPDHYEMWIFDRWGNMIFHTTDWNKGWNGKVEGGSEICQIDTYVWKIKAKDVIGNSHNLIGKVSLIK